MSEEEISLDLQDNATDDEREAVSNGLAGYNTSHSNISEARKLDIFLRNKNQEILGGLLGYTWGEVLAIRNLWVHEQLRGKGYGSKLMAEAEREAVVRNCTLAYLDTYSFQAPEFYKKLGYVVFGKIENPKIGQHKYFLRKSLR